MERKGSGREYGSAHHRSEVWEEDPLGRSYDDDEQEEEEALEDQEDEEPAAALDRLQAVTGSLVDSGVIPFTLGGEHSLTIAPVLALHLRYPELSVLQLDAHLDLREEYQGTKMSHASVMRRVRELGIPTV